MKGDPDTKYMTHQTMYFSDGTETTVEYNRNPNADEIVARVKAAQEDPKGLLEDTGSEEVIADVKCKKRGCKVMMSSGSPEFCPEHRE